MEKKLAREETSASSPIRRFLQVALKDFHHVASFFPSSRWAQGSVAKRLPEKCQVVVEYGPGDGAMTHRLLEALSGSGKLIAIERNASFLNELSRTPDPRLHLIHGDAEAYSARLKEWSPAGVDAVVSGIPFSFLTSVQRKIIVRNTRDGLRPGGKFIVYQNTPRMSDYLKQSFPTVELFLEPRNVFPYFIMVATA